MELVWSRFKSNSVKNGVEGMAITVSMVALIVYI